MNKFFTTLLNHGLVSSVLLLVRHQATVPIQDTSCYGECVVPQLPQATPHSHIVVTHPLLTMTLPCPHPHIVVTIPLPSPTHVAPTVRSLRNSGVNWYLTNRPALGSGSSSLGPSPPPSSPPSPSLPSEGENGALLTRAMQHNTSIPDWF